MGSQRGGSGVTGSQKQSAAKAFSADAASSRKAPRLRSKRGAGEGGGGAGGGGGTGGGGGGGAEQTQATGSISGQVLDARGRGIANAAVTLVESNTRTRTGADGTFEFADVEPGEYNVRVTHPNYVTAVRKTRVRAGRESDVKIRLQSS